MRAVVVVVSGGGGGGGKEREREKEKEREEEESIVTLKPRQSLPRRGVGNSRGICERRFSIRTELDW